MSAIKTLLTGSFERKLLAFTIAAVFTTAVLIFGYLIYNFQAITNFSLDRNTAGTEVLVEDFLRQFAEEKATTTSLQIQSAQDNLSVLGRTAQKIIDNYDLIRETPELLTIPLFQTQLEDTGGALSASPDDEYDAFIPPALADDPRARELLEASSLLNLSMDAVFAANPNNTFLYFVGDPESPVTRAYPNIHLAEVLGEGVNLLFWQDFFAANVEGWERWYREPALRDQFPSPITMEKPYADAAGQGLVLTMFYPLWDHENDRFAGAIGADITLDNIVANVLSFQVAETGFAFLMNGDGEVVAMPETGFQLFNVDLEPLEQEGGLTYYRGLLADSTDPAVQRMATDILASDNGLLNVALTTNASSERREIVFFESLPPLSGVGYEPDQWRMVVAVPESEVFATLQATDDDVNAERRKISFIALGITAGLLAVATILTVRFARTSTADLRTLSVATGQVAERRYDLDFRIRSNDEIGQLGRAFRQMAGEIRDYTDNLETKVAERTADLQTANSVISALNEKLRDENIRLGAELDVAQRIQSMVLPGDAEMGTVAGLELAAYMRPADEVGGDYYDVLTFDGRTLLGIGDVTGHGLPAGIIMLMAQTALLALAESGETDPRRVIGALNRVLYRNIGRIHEDKNMTLALVEYRNNEVQIVGQHESVLICRASGEVEEIDTVDLGFPMGLEPDIDQFIGLQTARLESDDVLVLYTDGVTEGENTSGELFGIDRLRISLAAHHNGSAAEIAKAVLDDLYAFIGDGRIHDDISLVIARQR